MQLDAKTTALVLIDLQRLVLSMPVAPHAPAQIVERSNALAGRLRAAGGRVVWVRVSFAPDLSDAPPQRVDQPTRMEALPAGWDEISGPVQAADVVVTKRQWGAFYGTDLDLQLRRRGIHRIVLGGIATTIGVESTARSAHEHGYELVLAEDLCADMDAQAHAASFARIFPRIARVTTSESLTFA